MPTFTDSLRGYGRKIYERDNYICRYCGLDGRQSFDTWLSFSVDHLLPKGHPNRDNPEYMVTACNFCNTADNRYFDLAEKRSLIFDGLTPDELVKQRLAYVQKTRQEYRKFWESNVRKP
jgi:HNH endonuclease